MAFIERFSTGWRQFLTALHPDSRQRLVEVLCDEYLDEAKDVAQFEDHARRMTYPQFREQLLRIAEEEKAHVKWLQDKIKALGGEIPQTTFTVKHGKNSWENLMMDIEEEKRDCASVLKQLYTVVEHADPDIAAELRRIRDDEKRHREEILDMLGKSYPYALPHVTADSAQLEKQKQTWLDLQKMEWFARRQAEWEAAGKPIPWAEWVGEKELEWRIKELPNRELIWTKHLAEQVLA